MAEEERRAAGQAVFEGVMMRDADRWAVAVRTPTGAVDLLTGELPPFGRRWRSVPLARGIVALAEALPLGMRAVRWSAERAYPDQARSPRWFDRPLTVVVVAAVLAVFVGGPIAAASALGAVTGSSLVFTVTEGALGLALLVAYLWLLGRVPEIRRLFENHGAEHKVVAAYETGSPLTPAAAARFTTRHVRCGTSFLLVVAVVAAGCYLLLGRPALPVLVVSRVALLPVVAAIAAELQLRAAENLDRRWVRALVRPGLALQGLTTREPTLDQLEVAIVALLAVLPAEERERVLGRAEADAPATVPALV